MFLFMNLIIEGARNTSRMRSGMSSRHCLGTICRNISRKTSAASAEVPRRVGASAAPREHVVKHECLVECNMLLNSNMMFNTTLKKQMICLYN